VTVAAVARDERGAVAGVELELAAVRELGPDRALDHVRELFVRLRDVVLHARMGREGREQRLHRVRAVRYEHLDVDALRRVVQHLAVVGPNHDRVGMARLRHEVDEPELVQPREPGQPADRDVAAPGLDQREQRAGDPRLLRHLREREAARGPDRAQGRPQRLLARGDPVFHVRLRRLDHSP
jgi:hypothetical protein